MFKIKQGRNMDQDLIKLKHERSVKENPEIDLHDGEYVVLNLHRSKIGVWLIWVTVAVCIIALTFILQFVAHADFATNNLLNINAVALGYLRLFEFALYILFIFAGFIGHTVYTANRMWITNMRVIQKIRTSLFNSSTQIIELIKIEDVSLSQKGIFQNLFRLGSIRMSTIGDETTYIFSMLDTPRDEVEVINDLVHAARNRKRNKKEAAKSAEAAKPAEAVAETEEVKPTEPSVSVESPKTSEPESTTAEPEVPEAVSTYNISSSLDRPVEKVPIDNDNDIIDDIDEASSIEEITDVAQELAATKKPAKSSKKRKTNTAKSVAKHRKQSAAKTSRAEAVEESLDDDQSTSDERDEMNEFLRRAQNKTTHQASRVMKDNIPDVPSPIIDELIESQSDDDAT